MEIERVATLAWLFLPEKGGGASKQLTSLTVCLIGFISIKQSQYEVDEFKNTHTAVGQHQVHVDQLIVTGKSKSSYTNH